MRLVFWLAALVLGYTYFGYPTLLWLRAWLCPRPVRRAAHEPTVSVVMVVRNEAEVLERKLRNLLKLEYPAGCCQIVIVSDGSTDCTEDILRRHAEHPGVQILLNHLSRGKASGLNDAISMATGDIVVFTDARQQLEPNSIRVLMENFADTEVGCASGALMLGDSETGETGKGMGLYWRVEKKIRELESGCGSVVGATGAIYAVRRALLTQIPEGTILDDVYIPMEVARQGRRVIFDDRVRAWDSPDLGTEREFSRKVRTLSGNYQLVQLAPWLLSNKNPIRFQFVCHKLLRLGLPFALSVLLFAPIFLSGPLYRSALVFQLLFYGLSAIAGFRLGWGPLGRIADAALTFVMLNSAAAVAFVNFVTGRKAAWAR
jgi:poly-beta-1,6-N-acetyl-D-glucosamine synthase